MKQAIRVYMLWFNFLPGLSLIFFVFGYGSVW